MTALHRPPSSVPTSSIFAFPVLLTGCRCSAISCRNAPVDRLVLFAPIAQGAREKMPASFPAWRIVTLQDQWNRFVEDVPVREPPVLSRVHFDAWGERYLDSDPESRAGDLHMEAMRPALWQESVGFLLGGDVASVP